MKLTETRVIAAPLDAVYAALVEDDSPAASASGATPQRMRSDGRTWLETEGSTPDAERATLRFDLREVSTGTELTSTIDIRFSLKLRVLLWLISRFSKDDPSSELMGLLDEMGPELEHAAQDIARGVRPARPPMAGIKKVRR